MNVKKTVEYFNSDYAHTLFPLTSTRVLVNAHAKQLLEHVYEKILRGTGVSFLPQTRCYASKHGFHVRRTVKLDPVAELFMYDLIYRNRGRYRADFSPNRRSFGYRFSKGEPLSAKGSYVDFKRSIASAKTKFKHAIKFDIAAYFNSLYHHDLTAWLDGIGAPGEDVQAFGRFLREANNGRSIDCLPQGIHPCKVIGAEFLKFVDSSISLKCELMLRFMDDFYIFSEREEVVTNDFISVQKLLGEKGLTLNQRKTEYGPDFAADIEQKIDDIKIDLLRRRRELAEPSGVGDEWLEDSEDDEDEEDEEEEDDGAGDTEPDEANLTPEQIEYLLGLLRDADIDEADAELVLVLLRERGEDVLQVMHVFLERFPALSRNIYNFASYVLDQSELASLLHKFLKTSKVVTEDQLFWIAKIAEEYLSKTSGYGNILAALLEHPNATPISQAKVLEIPERRFGMPDIREQQLRGGNTDWKAWAAATGCRNDKKARLNYMLKYFANVSPMNRLVAECVQGLSNIP